MTVVSGFVQNAKPGTVAAGCAKLTNTSISNPIQRLGAWISEQIGGGCLLGQYEQMLYYYGNTSYNGALAENRMWRYQTCHDFGWYQSTTSASQPFGSNMPVEFFRRTCRDFYDQMYDASAISENMRRTNTFLGRSPTDNTIFIKGTEDPWSLLQPTLSQTSSKTPVYEIQAAHCRATDSIQTSITEEVRRVKKKVVEHVKHFISTK